MPLDEPEAFNAAQFLRALSVEAQDPRFADVVVDYRQNHPRHPSAAMVVGTHDCVPSGYSIIS